MAMNDNQELPADSEALPARTLFDLSEWLKFNVGGTLLETTRATIDHLGSTFFALLLDPDIDDIHGPVDEVYRIDRDPEPLKVLLNYGRYDKIVSIPDNISETYLYEEIAFYKMSEKVKKAVSDFYEQKRKGPGTVHLESVTITDLVMDRKHQHHNVYGLIRGKNMCCFTKVMGSGVCYKDCTLMFAYEMPRAKYPALWRATCIRCGLKTCMADDPLIGLEGWCHNCQLCLRCQDILCGFNDNRPKETVGVDDNGNKIVRKTAQVVFVEESPSAPPQESGTTQQIEDDTESEMDIGRVMLGKNRRQSVVDDSVKLPKLPKSVLHMHPQEGTHFAPLAPIRRKSMPVSSSLDSTKTFQEYLETGKW